MQNKLTKSMVKTLCYAEIFSYPLAPHELWKYLMHHRKVTEREFTEAFKNNSDLFIYKNGLLALSGQGELFKIRTERTLESTRKMKKALFISHILSLIPTVKLIGVSGSLAMMNAKKEDDIDLFFITSKNTLWLTRFLVNVVLCAIKEKRPRQEKFAMDKVCPNMFISMDALRIKKNKQCIYLAHEIAQLRVLIDKDETYQHFLRANAWVLSLMPHAFLVSKTKSAIRGTPFLYPVEYLFYLLQKWYMRKRVTREKIEKNLAMFHPLKTREVVEEIFALKVKERKISHKSVFSKKRFAQFRN